MTSVRWRREDAAYAAATMFAATLVVYLTAGNFGLVPSPFAPAVESARPIGVPALQALAGPGGGLGGLGAEPVVPTVPDIPGGGPPTAPQPPAAGDQTPPAVDIGTPGGSILVSLSGDSVRGTASDDSSGVDRVAVTFSPALGQPTVRRAGLTCATGLTCTWSVAPPSLIGSYTIEARAVDRAGNSAQARPVKDVVIVEVQPSSQASSGDAVGGVVGTVGDTAGELLGGIL